MSKSVRCRTYVSKDMLIIYQFYQIILPIISLAHRLAKIYVDTSPDVKRTILRQVEPPIRAMGIDSPELMKLLDSFPKGAETLVTRIIHILTDKSQ